MGRYHADSISSDDDTPVLQLKARNASVARSTPTLQDMTAALYMYCQENCQFCDKICYNKYEHLVHNASHITIPLNRNSLPHCLPCKRYFKSKNRLKSHNKKRHKQVPEILASIVRNTPVVKCDSSVNELIRLNNEQKLSDFISKQVVVRCDNSLKELLKASNEVVECDSTVKEPVVDSKVMIKAPSPVIYEIDDDDDDIENGDNNDEEKAVISNIKSRIVFESDDDVEDDIIQLSEKGVTSNGYGVICDLTTDDDDDDENDRNSKLNTERKTENTKSFSDDEENNRNNKQNDKTKNHMILGSKEVYTPSVHYDNLMEPGEYRCTRCRKVFENRYNLILHEKTHVKFRLRHPCLCKYCDRYIAGNFKSLNAHMYRVHGETTNKKRQCYRCKKCNLKYYSIFKHTMNYHRIYVCPSCEHRFEDETERDSHVATCKGTEDNSAYLRQGIRVAKICELCALFCKNTQCIKYIHLGEFSKDGERVRCERCEKKFFEVKLVKLITKFKMPSQKKKPVLTNTDRLKNIQQRLKMISRLNKC